MGTRNSTLVISNGQTKIGQYCQWDGYPEGQGKTAIEFLNTLKTQAAWTKFRNAVNGLKSLADEEVQAKLVKCGATPGKSLVSINVAEKFKKKYPHLERSFGAHILKAVHSGKVTEVAIDDQFVKNGLFCEWAYVIDLDLGTFEVYKGFTNNPIHETERFYFDGYFEESHDKTYKYYPVRLVELYFLDELPTVEQFLEASKGWSKLDN